jgi:uncharacterized protein
MFALLNFTDEGRLAMRPVLLTLVVAVAQAGLAHAAEPTFPERPEQREFIRDEVEVFNPIQAGRVRFHCDKLLTDTGVPIVVVTLPSLEQYADKDMTLEEYARQLFNHWGIGHQELNGKPGNRGILVLYIKDTGKVRVQLGAGWGHGDDAVVRQILVEGLVPRREAGDVAGGLLTTVEGLEGMVRKTQPAGTSWLVWLVMAVVGGGLGYFGLALFRLLPWGGLAVPGKHLGHGHADAGSEAVSWGSVGSGDVGTFGDGWAGGWDGFDGGSFGDGLTDGGGATV